MRTPGSRLCIFGEVLILTGSILLQVSCSAKERPSDTVPVQSSSAEEQEKTNAAAPQNTAPQNSAGAVTQTTQSGEESAPLSHLDINLQKNLAYIKDTSFQGTILVARDGEIVFEESYGYADIGQKVFNKEETRYEIGSVTKQFTAVGLMMLVEDGEIGLDDTLNMYLPEYSHANEVTIRQLLNMTSGVPDYVSLGLMDFALSNIGEANGSTDYIAAYQELCGQEFNIERVLEVMNEYDLDFVPGTNFGYSNTAYAFLSEVIERVSGMPFEDYMSECVLYPAGLASASFEASNGTATGYLALADSVIPIPPVDVAGEGGLRMTTADLYKWTQGFMSHEWLSKESWEEILDGGEYGYGFGIFVTADTYWHDGTTSGFISSEIMYPSIDLVIIALSNIVQVSPVISEMQQTVEEYYDLA